MNNRNKGPWHTPIQCRIKPWVGLFLSWQVVIMPCCQNTPGDEAWWWSTQALWHQAVTLRWGGVRVEYCWQLFLSSTQNETFLEVTKHDFLKYLRLIRKHTLLCRGQRSSPVFHHIPCIAQHFPSISSLSHNFPRSPQLSAHHLFSLPLVIQFWI